MLTALSIRDIVLVDALDLEVEGGLTVLTGETGAGKSIILDALGLALGARAQRQTQGVEDDRLARPGLAGQHGQAALDLEIERVHQHDVADGEGGQHEGAVVRV